MKSLAVKVGSALRAHAENVLVTGAFLVGLVAIPLGLALEAGAGAGLMLGGTLVLACVLLYAKGRL